MRQKIVLVGVLCVGFLVGFFAARPKVAPALQTIDKVVYVDRVVTKDRQVVKTVTKPDGTKVVTETKTKIDVQETSKTAETVTQKPAQAAIQARYSLGLGVRLDPFILDRRIYHIEMGRRLWESPFWVKAQVTTDKTVSLGLSVEF